MFCQVSFKLPAKVSLFSRVYVRWRFFITVWPALHIAGEYLVFDRYSGFHESRVTRSPFQDLLCKGCNTWSTMQYYVHNNAWSLVAIFGDL